MNIAKSTGKKATLPSRGGSAATAAIAFSRRTTPYSINGGKQKHSQIEIPQHLPVPARVISVPAGIKPRNGGRFKVYCGTFSEDGIEVRVAFKALKYRNHIRYETEQLRNEAVLIKELDHKNIVKLSRFSKELVCDAVIKIAGTKKEFNEIGVALEQGDCDLYRLIKTKRVSKKTEDAVIRDMLAGFKYLHDQDVVHLDMKLENILCFESVSGEHQFKICDFGHSRKKSQLKRFDDGVMRPWLFDGEAIIYGTYSSMSLDTKKFLFEKNMVEKNTLGLKINLKAEDMFTLGATIYSMLTQKFIYPEIKKDDQSINWAAYESYCEIWVKLNVNALGGFSRKNIKLLSGLLDYDHSARLTIDQATALYNESM